MDAVQRLTAWFDRAAARAGPAADGEDWRLLRAANQGDDASARRLVQWLTPQAHGLALRLLGRGEDAEDAVQEAFMRLWKSAAVDGHGARLATYFNAIVINRCRSMLVARREWATDPTELGQLHDELQSQGLVPEPEPGTAASMARLGGSPGPASPLAAALARLPVRQRMAITMWAYADAPVAEIALALELDANATHQLLHRARLALRQHLEGDPR